MVKLRYGYLCIGMLMGLIMLVSFIASIPDGKIHIYFCDVGQGDGAYIRFPDGRDMLIDGGPDDNILYCLGRHMPFWDRHINMVALTHPQKDHMQGLISVLKRYAVDYIVRSDIGSTSDGYENFLNQIRLASIPIKIVSAGDTITVGRATLSVYWPSIAQLSKSHMSANMKNTSSVLGATTDNSNDYSLVFAIRFGAFDALFTGDADSHVQHEFTGIKLADKRVELLKIPHHGSKTGMTDEFIKWTQPSIAVISVGKNSYGHPSDSVLADLKQINSRIFRTDLDGDIEVVSDGVGWSIKTTRRNAVAQHR